MLVRFAKVSYKTIGINLNINGGQKIQSNGAHPQEATLSLTLTQDEGIRVLQIP